MGAVLASSDLEPFAGFINAVTKYVATSSRMDPQWVNSQPIDGDLTTFVRTLKDQPGGDIGVHGSISVAKTLLGAGLIDELTLVVVPAIAGSGRQLLEGLPAHRLECLRSTLSPQGKLLVTYRWVD